MNAMRRGNELAASPAPSNRAGGSMTSSSGRATTVPSPFKKVRRGICQVLFIRLFCGWLTDEITPQTLQTQAAILNRVIGVLEWWSDGKRLEAASRYSTTPSLHPPN